VCQYLRDRSADHDGPSASASLGWAIAGRARSKLEHLVEELGLGEVEILTADADDDASLAELASSTVAVIATVRVSLASRLGCQN
jgi:short subunit dehydrogenase-like uncharacterized protein